MRHFAIHSHERRGTEEEGGGGGRLLCATCRSLTEANGHSACGASRHLEIGITKCTAEGEDTSCAPGFSHEPHQRQLRVGVEPLYPNPFFLPAVKVQFAVCVLARLIYDDHHSGYPCVLKGLDSRTAARANFRATSLRNLP